MTYTINETQHTMMNFYKTKLWHSFIILFTFLAISTQYAVAQTTWTSVASGAWNNAATWDQSTAPPTELKGSQRIVITNGHTVTNNSNILMESTSRLTIQNGGRLSMTGSVTFTMKGSSNEFNISNGVYSTDGNAGNMLIEEGKVDWRNGSLFVSGNLDFKEKSFVTMINMCVRVGQSMNFEKTNTSSNPMVLNNTYLLAGTSGTGSLTFKETFATVTDVRMKVGSSSGSALFEKTIMNGSIFSIFGNQGINVVDMQGTTTLEYWWRTGTSPSTPTYFTGSKILDRTITEAQNCDAGVFYSISGTVFSDNDAGTIDGTGIGTAASQQLYISLVDGANNINATVAVGSNGAYSFGNLGVGNYTLVLHLTQGGSKIAALPSGWENTAEGIGTAGDGTPDGKILVSGLSSNITDALFGIRAEPVFYDISGTVFNDTDAGTIDGTGIGTAASQQLYISLIDADDDILATIAVDADGTYSFDDVAPGDYTLVLHLTPGGSTSAALPSGWQNTAEGIGTAGDGTPDGKILVSGLSSNITNALFGIRAVYDISGTVFNDNDAGTIDGTGIGSIGIQQLYISLIDGTNNINATVAVASDGTYSFDDVAPGNYTLVLHLTLGGSTSAALPTLWQNTAEGIGTAGDGTPNGVISITVSTSNITNALFGIRLNAADLEITKTIDNTTPLVGSTVTFSITIENNGPQAATGISVQDVVPNGYSSITSISSGGTLSGSTITWSGLSIANGADVTLTFNAVVQPGGPGIVYNNTATITASSLGDQDTNNNSSTVTVTPTTEPTPPPTYTWTGNESDDWCDPLNWDGGVAPTLGSNVIIPSTANDPVINVSSCPVCINDLTIGDDVTLGLTGKLCVTGDLTSDGSIDGTGSILLKGTTEQTISGDFKINNLELDNHAGAVITAGEGNMMDIAGSITLTKGSLTTNDNLRLLSDEDGDAYFAPILDCDDVSIIGNVRIQKFVKGGNRAFRFIAHPFNNTLSLEQIREYIHITGEGLDFNLSGNPSAFWYVTDQGNQAEEEEDSGWVAVSSTNIGDWFKGRAVRIFIRGPRTQDGVVGDDDYDAEDVTYELIGEVNLCEQILENLVRSGEPGNGDDEDGDGVIGSSAFNFIGNPYPAAIDLKSIPAIDREDIGINYYVWQPRTGLEDDQKVFGPGAGRGGSYIAEPFDGGTAALGELAIGTGFFVFALEDSASLRFTEANKLAKKKLDPDAAVTFRKDNEFTSRYGANSLQLAIGVNGKQTDRVLVYFDQETKAKVDNMDATKFENPSVNFFTVSEDDYALAIDRRPWVENKEYRIPVYILSPAVKYTLTVPDFDLDAGRVLQLHDRHLDKLITLEKGASYEFEVTNNQATKGHRFDIVMGVDVVTSLDQTADRFQAFLLPNPAQQQVMVSIQRPDEIADTYVRLVDMFGVEIYKTMIKAADDAQINFEVGNIAKGIYLVEITHGRERIVKRLIVK